MKSSSEFNTNKPNQFDKQGRPHGYWNMVPGGYAKDKDPRYEKLDAYFEHGDRTGTWCFWELEAIDSNLPFKRIQYQNDKNHGATEIFLNLLSHPIETTLASRLIFSEGRTTKEDFYKNRKNLDYLIKKYGIDYYLSLPMDLCTMISPLPLALLDATLSFNSIEILKLV
jgi:hypothetical protein